MALRVVSPVGPGNDVLDGPVHWRHLANTVERLQAAAMNGSTARGGDAACSQIASSDPQTLNILSRVNTSN